MQNYNALIIWANPCKACKLRSYKYSYLNGQITLGFLPTSLLVFAYGKILWKKVYNRVRRFRLWYHGNPVYMRAVTLRKEIVKTLDKVIK